MTAPFTLAACAEMLWQERPIEWRARRLSEIGYAAIARALVAMGYRGPVGMEAFASGDPEVALEAFRAAFTP